MTNINSLRITTFQPKTRINDLDYNINNYLKLIDKFSSDIQSSNIICFPEYWNGIRKNIYSDELHNKSKKFLQNLASKYSIWVVGGSQITQENGNFYNRSYIFNPSGKLIGKYDKKQLFGFENVQEIIAGNNEMIWKIDEWKVGVRICSDLWNTSDYSKLMRKKVDLLFCPALTIVPDYSYTNYGRFLWNNLALIRSKESVTAIIVSDTAMQPIREPFWCTGATCVADPSKKFKNNDPIGKDMLNVKYNGEEGIISILMNLNEIHEQREYRKEIGLLKMD